MCLLLSVSFLHSVSTAELEAYVYNFEGVLFVDFGVVFEAMAALGRTCNTVASVHFACASTGPASDLLLEVTTVAIILLICVYCGDLQMMVCR